METRHIDRRFEDQLKDLRERLLLMSGRVEEMIKDSVLAFLSLNQELARQTILKDRQVNSDEIQTDRLCLQLLARQRPMGSDLRFITRSLKMVTDLERIGDLAVNICERTISLRAALPAELHHGIPPLAGAVCSQLHQAIDAFVQQDAAAARVVKSQDGGVDQMYRAVYQLVLKLMQQGQLGIEPGIQVESVSKTLERMADHATNIAEAVIYIVDGTDIRHEGKTTSTGRESSQKRRVY